MNEERALVRHKVIAALGTALLVLITACSPAPIVNIPSASSSIGTEPLVVATPQVPDGVIPSEGALLAHVYSAALTAAGVQASVAPNAVSPRDAVSGLEDDLFDVVPSYSRLALAAVSSSSTVSSDAEDGDAADVLAALKKELPDTVLSLDASKAEVRENVVVTAVTAEKYQLKTITDVAKECKDFDMAGPAEFKVAPRGLPGLSSSYKCVPKSYKSLAPSLDQSDKSITWSLLRDDVQIAVINSSSPAIVDNSLVVLDDPEQLFLAQTVVPLVSEERVDSTVQDVINKVSSVLNTEELGNLNRLSQDRHYGDLSEVAKAWLIQKGLLKASS